MESGQLRNNIISQGFGSTSEIFGARLASLTVFRISSRIFGTILPLASKKIYEQCPLLQPIEIRLFCSRYYYGCSIKHGGQKYSFQQQQKVV